MNLKKIKNATLFSILLVFGFFNFIPQNVLAVSGANFQFQIISYCNNGVVDSNEQCDGYHLAGQTCVTLGFTEGGILTCKSNCLFNTSQCIIKNIGGRRSVDKYVMPITSAIFEGRAYPNSTVTLLKDAQIATTTIADINGNFQLDISDISDGNYSFSFYSEDDKGVRSSLLTFSGSITFGAVNKISGIYIAPTIAVDKTEVKQGDNILISGQSYPNSNIGIYIDPNVEPVNNIQTGASGRYVYDFNTSILNIGTNLIKTKSTLNIDMSSFSTVLSLNVGDKLFLSTSTDAFLKKVDLNNDGGVSIIDFSIMAYWYGRSLPPASIDLNGDGKIDLVDFSIMAFYWTG